MTFYWLAGTMTIFVIYCKNGDIQKKPKATFCKMCLCLSGMQCCCWCRIKLLLSFPACECLIIFHTVFTWIGSSLVCNLCNKKQIDKYRLNRHIKTHAPGWVRKPKPPTKKIKSLCNICSKWLASRGQLNVHTKYVHDENRHQPCSNCELNIRVSCIKSHERICKLSDEEKEAIMVECGECGKFLANKENLTMKTHIKNNHHGEDPKKSFSYIGIE